MHRRVEAGGVEQEGELRRVAVEVALEHPADPADRAVALRLVEQLLDHRPQGASIAEELLEGPRQAAVAIGEVGAQGLLERLGGLLVDRLGLADELLELGPDDIDVDRHAGVLEREQADPEGALDEPPGRPRLASRGTTASAGSRMTSRSTTIRSPSRRTRVGAGHRSRRGRR